MNTSRTLHPVRSAEPLTLQRFIELARPVSGVKEAKTAFRQLVRHVVRWDERELDVYCPECMETFRHGSCTHVSLDPRHGKPAPAIDPGSLAAFVDDFELTDISGIGEHRVMIIRWVVQIL